MAEGCPTSSTAGPRRRWRLEFWDWIIIALVGICVLSIATWAIWLAGASRQKDLALEEARKAGIATTAAELLRDLEPVPDEANVAIDVLAAAALVDFDGTAMQEWQGMMRPDSMLTERERGAFPRLLADVVTEQAAVIERVMAVDTKVPPAVEQVRADAGGWSRLKLLVEAGEQPEWDKTPTYDPGAWAYPSRLLLADARVAASSGHGPRATGHGPRATGHATVHPCPRHC